MTDWEVLHGALLAAEVAIEMAQEWYGRLDGEPRFDAHGAVFHLPQAQRIREEAVARLVP